ncbi:MAG TPA: hypothetical protein PK402_07435 [Tepidisphaeraceae bacterium]|nr:hypothetical protein [Tepidisphaeraceae bacterium]
MAKHCPICGEVLRAQTLTCPHCLNGIDFKLPRVPIAVAMGNYSLFAFAVYLWLTGRPGLAVVFFLLVAVAVLVTVAFMARFVEVVPARRCFNCGYSLVDKEHWERCPECGKKPSERPQDS